MNRNSAEDKINLVIISGRSGSGKSVALKVLEDLGYYCIDNLPVMFLKTLVDMAKHKYPKLAVDAVKGNPVQDVDTGALWYNKDNMDSPEIAPCLYR